MITTNEIIDKFGGSTKTANLFSITEAAVSHWRREDRIPPARLMYLKLLRPDVFVEQEHSKLTEKAE